MIENILAHHYYDEESQVELRQTLSSHLINVGEEASKIGSMVGCPNMMLAIGLLHDLGKASTEFQNYLIKKTNDHVNHSSAGGKYIIDYVDSKLSKKLAEEEGEDLNVFKEILAYVIFAHHNFFDIISTRNSEEVNVFTIRRDYDSKYDNKSYGQAKEYISYLDEELKKHDLENINTIIEKAYIDFKKINKKIEEGLVKHIPDISTTPAKARALSKNTQNFYNHILVRLFLSILKEADITDTIRHSKKPVVEEYDDKEISKFWQESLDNIEKKYEIFAQIKTDIARSRCLISEKVLESSYINSSGIHKFYLPTGGGKNLAGLRYALSNLDRFSKKRIIYVTSFISILEQNAHEIKKAISDTTDSGNSDESMARLDRYVLEHHSNVIKDKKYDMANSNYYDLEENEDELKTSYLEDSWLSPLILTTTVQFFNSLFAGRAANLRRFSKLINSVIIIDEVQAIPSRFTYLLNLMFNFLSKIMGANIILSSATQPKLDHKKLKYPIIYGGDKDPSMEDLIDLSQIDEKKLDVFDRVDIINMTGCKGQIKMDGLALSAFILEKIKGVSSLLLVLNTRAGVMKMYKNIKNELDKDGLTIKVFYLTTYLCARHRLDRIKQIKDLIKRGEKIICISTNLVEAGVDFDFNVAIRTIAGIDSIIQTAGRCNREGRLGLTGKKGQVFIVNYSEENWSLIKGIERPATVTGAVIRDAYDKGYISNDGKMLNEDYIKNKYYEIYYEDYLSELDVRKEKDGDSFLNRLGTNSSKRFNYRQITGKKLESYLAQDFLSVSQELKLIDDSGLGLIVPYQNEDIIDDLLLAIGKQDYRAIKKNLKTLQPYTVSVRYDQLARIEDKYDQYLDKIFILKKEFYSNDIGIDFNKEVKLEALII